MTDLGEAHWYIDVVRDIFGALDTLIYNVLAGMFNIFYMIAGVEIQTGEVVHNFFSRIQIILGVIIVFKLIIALFSGIVDPDSLKDQKNGVGSVIKRVVVVLVMLMLIVPLNIPENNTNDTSLKNSIMTWNQRMNQSGILFGTLYELQSRILNDNVIQNIILGTKDIDEKYSTNGDLISTYLLQNFLVPNLKPGTEDFMNNENWVCHNHLGSSESGMKAFVDVTYNSDNYSKGYLNYQYIRDYLLDNVNIKCQIGDDDDDGWHWYHFLVPVQGIVKLSKDIIGGLQSFFGANEGSATEGTKYFFVYHYILSTIAGVIFFIMILSLALDMAVRVFKLALLRLISPIAILSYIDPKSEKTFNNWVKALSQTYLDVFIRVAVVSFIMLFIRILPGVKFDMSYNNVISNMVAHMILVFGLLFFAKEAPKFIEETLGIDSKGSMGLFNGIGKLRAGTSAVGGIASGAISKAAATRANGGNLAKSTLAFLSGGIGGGINSGKEFFKDGSDVNSIKQANQRNVDQNYARISSGSTAGGRTLSRLQRGLGLRTTAQRFDNDIKELRESNAAWNRLDSALNSDDSKLKLRNKKGEIIDTIKDSKGKALFQSKLGYSLEGIDRMIETMEKSGKYSNEDIDAVKQQRDDFAKGHNAIGIKDSKGNIIKTIASFKNGYSVKDMNDVLKDMENSGQYSAEELMNVRQQLKDAQKQRFGEIAIEGDMGIQLGGTASQVYQAANTIRDIGGRYSDQVKGFNAFANAQGTSLSQALADGTLNMSRDFKGGTFDAVREADAKEASKINKIAHEDDKFSEQKNGK